MLDNSSGTNYRLFAKVVRISRWRAIPSAPVIAGLQEQTQVGIPDSRDRAMKGIIISSSGSGGRTPYSDALSSPCAAFHPRTAREPKTQDPVSPAVACSPSAPTRRLSWLNDAGILRIKLHDRHFHLTRYVATGWVPRAKSRRRLRIRPYYAADSHSGAGEADTGFRTAPGAALGWDCQIGQEIAGWAG